MSRELFNDLASKLGKGATSFQDIDIKNLINQVDSLDKTERQTKLQNLLSEFQTAAENYRSGKKYRESAHVFYLGGMLTRHYFPDNIQNFEPWFQNSVSNLINLAEEYLTWKEIDRAAASISLANLLTFLYDKQWELHDFYSNFLSSNSSMIQQGKTASGSLWVPNFIVSAIKELNSESLQQADQYAQMYLLAEAKTTNLYKEGIIQVFNLARERLSKAVKIPSLKVDSLLPKDLTFGEKFSLKLKIIKEGEGQIKNLSADMTDPKGITRVSTNQNQISSLERSNQVELSWDYSHPVVKGKEEEILTFQGQVQFDDVLGNRRSFLLGPYSLTIRAFRKSDQLLKQINELHSSIKQQTEKIQIEKPNTALEEHKRDIFKFIENIVTASKNELQKGNFDGTNSLLVLLNNIKEGQLLNSEMNLVNDSQLAKNKSKDILNQIDKNIEQNNLISKNIEEKFNALQKLMKK
ncbi:MAG: hypothetical protein ACFFD1_03720 [Candidatus Thorarchaeota archaeon]